MCRLVPGPKIAVRGICIGVTILGSSCSKAIEQKVVGLIPARVLFYGHFIECIIMKSISKYYAGCTTRVKLAKNTPMGYTKILTLP